MLLIVELLFLGAGLWALVKGRIPAWLMGGQGYVVEGSGARIIGIILILPFPVAFLTGLVLAAVFGKDALAYAVLVEMLVVVLVGVSAVIVARLARKPTQTPEGADTEAIIVERDIARKATGSLIYALTCFLGFAGLVLGPLAALRATQALKLIKESGLGEQYRTRALIARILGLFFLAFWLFAAVALGLTALSGFSLGQ